MNDMSDEVMSNEVTSEQFKTTGKVFDAELGEMVEISPERQRIAMALQQRIDVATLVTAVALKKISDEKYFLEMGYSSFKEYANIGLPFGERQAKKYLTIGRKFEQLLPNNWDEGNSSSLLEEGNEGKLASLGVAKLYELARVEDADFSDVISEGRVTLADGSELDLDEIKQQSAKDLRDHLAAKDKYQRELEEELNKTAAAKEKAEKRAKQAEQDAETGMKYKELYGPKSKEFEAFKARIAVAHSRALDLNQALSQITDLPGEEFPVLADEIRDLHKVIDRGLDGLKQDNFDVRF